MRKTIFTTILIWLIFLSPSLLHATGPWVSFLRLMDNHYFFDTQGEGVNRVECRVVISTLDAKILRDQLRPYGDRVTLNEDLKSFKVIYTKRHGITFGVPHLEIVLNSTEGFVDPKLAERGVRMINAGAQMQIRGAMKIIKAVLDDLLFPQKDSLGNLEVSFFEGKTTVKYRKDDVFYTEVYAGNTKKFLAKSPAVEIKADEEFTTLKGKLARGSSTASMRQGDTSVDSALAVRYQDLGKLFFPSVLEQHVKVKTPNLTQEVQIRISLADCETE